MRTAVASVLGMGLLLSIAVPPPLAQGEPAKVPAVGDGSEIPGFSNCTVVRVGPGPFSYTSHGKKLFLDHAEDRWVNHMEYRNTIYTMVVDPSVPSARIGDEEFLTEKDPKGGHYFLVECD